MFYRSETEREGGGRERERERERDSIALAFISTPVRKATLALTGKNFLILSR